MNKTNIDWATHVWNPVIGCKRGCPYCYAKKINDRFHIIPDFSVPTWRESSFVKSMPKNPARIFVNSMSDICYWKEGAMIDVIERIKDNPKHTFIFLTKDGRVYDKYIFPKNCWLGLTYDGIINNLNTFYTYADNKFISIEPLLYEIPESVLRFIANKGIKWVIVGGLTPNPKHKKEWVDKLVEMSKANGDGLPIFLKNNLHYPEIIQQYLKESK